MLDCLRTNSLNKCRSRGKFKIKKFKQQIWEILKRVSDKKWKIKIFKQ